MAVMRARRAVQCLLVTLMAMQPIAVWLDVVVSDYGDFNVTMDGDVWLSSGQLRAFADNQWAKAGSTGLVHNGTVRCTGTDSLGHYALVNVSWTLLGRLPLHTSVKVRSVCSTSEYATFWPLSAHPSSFGFFF